MLEAFRRGAIAVVAASFYSGCACGTSTPGELTTITAEGTGPTNTEPLFPLRPGQLVQSTLLSEPVTMAGREVFAWGNNSAFSAGALLPRQPAMWQYLSKSGDDVLVLGTPRTGLFQHPALFVPGTVRVGMSWSSTLSDDGGTPWVATVTARAERETLYGRRVVWTIQIADPTNPTNDWNFIEGRGPMEWANGLTFGNPTTAQFGVVPLEAQPTPPARPKLTLTSLNKELISGEDGLVLSRLMATSNPTVEGELLRVAVISQTFTFGAERSFETGACVGFDVAQGKVVDIGDQCVDPAISLPLDDGTFAQFTADDVLPNHLRGCRFDAVGTRICSSHFHLTGLFHSPDGPRVFADTGAGLTLGKFFGTRLNGDNLVEPVPYGPAFWGLSALGLSEQQKFASLAPDGTLRVLADEGLQGLLFASIPPGGRVANQHVSMGNPGRLGMVASPSGRTFTRVTPDGRVEGVTLTNVGLEVEPLGQVELPDGHFLAGALRVKDTLFVVTHHGYGGTRAKPSLGSLSLWKTQVAAQPPRAVSPVLGGVEAQAFNADVRVCWPPGQGEVVTTGWTLATHAPAKVLPLGNCVLLVRDRSFAVDLTQLGAYAIEGSVPGLGRVAIGLAPPMAQTGTLYLGMGTLEALTPLKEGGALSAEFLYQPGGIVDTSSSLIANPRVTQFGGVPDSAGNGLWVGLRNPDGLGLLNAAGVREVTLPSGASPSTTGLRVHGGGVVLQGNVVLRPDGTSFALPSLPTDFVPLVVMGPGLVCGLMPNQLPACVDAQGSVTTVPTPDANERQVELIAASDSVLYLHWAPLILSSTTPGTWVPEKLSRWSLSTNTVTDVALSTWTPPDCVLASFGTCGATFTHFVTYAPDGAAYLLLKEPHPDQATYSRAIGVGRRRLYLLGAAGASLVADDVFEKFTTANTVRVFAERDLLLITHTPSESYITDEPPPPPSGLPPLVRIPR